jgi:putative ABC transport system permease protein
METLLQDIRYGSRMLLKRPGFTLVAVLTLGLGIGANSVIFSVVNGVLVRPLPFGEPERLVYVWGRNRTLGISQGYLSAADVVDYRERSRSFEKIAAYTTVPVNLTGTGQAERLEGILVTTNFFQTLGVEPVLGRAFMPEEGLEGRDRVVTISYALWRRQFGGDPNLIGRTIRLDRIDANSFTVVGVMPAEFQFPQRTDVWMPFEFDAEETRGGGHDFRVIARLKPGGTLGQAQAEVDAIGRGLAEQYPATNAGWDLMLVTFTDYIFGNTSVALLMLLAAVWFVLLIACTNVANLQLARAVARHKELAIRTALGAGRARIIRQLLTENLLLAMLGGALGLLLAEWGLDLLRALGPDSIPRLSEVSINSRALGFTIALSLVTGVIFGLVPALQVSKLNLNEALKEGGRSANASSARHNRVRAALVVSQVALALVLLIGAGLMIKSFLRLREVDPGFNAENILTAGISLTRADYPQDDPRRTAFFQQVIGRVKALPGVASAGAISHLPLGGRGVNMRFTIDGGSPASPTDELAADLRVTSPGYFETMEIPLMKGRVFTEGDAVSTPRVIIVNESFARRFFPGSDPVGRHLKVGASLFTGEIVGVIGNVRHRGLEAEARPEIYISYLQNTLWPVMNLVVRTSSDPNLLASAVRSEIQAVDKDQPVFNIKTMDQLLSESVAQRRFSMMLLGAFAVLALLLAAAGLYGVMSYLVGQRTHEIGVRMALGAQSVDVLRLILGQGLRLTLIGIAIGLLAAFALTRVLTTLLYGVKATDPATFVSIPLLLTLVALLACYVPARRAMKVDPMIALRNE